MELYVILLNSFNWFYSGSRENICNQNFLSFANIFNQSWFPVPSIPSIWYVSFYFQKRKLKQICVYIIPLFW